MEKKLKPVVYTTNSYTRGAPQTTQQIILLKAMQVTQDPKKLKEMIGVKTVAEVYRTLDKMAIRAEYHEALARSGISLDYILGGIKKIADNGEKDGDRLKAFTTLMKSLGLDKYEDSDSAVGGDWEQELVKAIDEGKSDVANGGGENEAYDNYEVNTPEVPESIKKMRKIEAELTDSVYD